MTGFLAGFFLPKKRGGEKNMNMKKIIVSVIAAGSMMFATALPTFADTVGPINFENPTYSTGSISGQDGWSNSVNPSYDQAVVSNTYGFPSFGGQTFRMSDGVTSGSFGDWVFVKPLTDGVGETAATAGSFSVGTRQTHFEMQFDIASTQSTEQPGLHVSVSPDRGDGSRMSYLRFDDKSDGIHVMFDDVTDPGPLGTGATFNESDIAIIDRNPHTIKLTLDTLDGSANDVVKVYVDGVLKKTGTSWEDYYRFDPEASAEQSPRIVKTMIMQARGDAHSGNTGKGFVFDNISLKSGPTPPSTVQVHIFKYVNGVAATAANANNAVFPMETSFNSPNLGNVTNAPFTLSPTGWGSVDTAYEASFVGSEPGADYTAHEVTGGSTVGSTCSTGQPFALDGYSIGDSLSQAQSAGPSMTVPSFTNLQSDKYMIVWNKVCVGPPTKISECKNDGWKTFNNPTFTNQGKCVSYTRTHANSILGNVKYTAGGLARTAQFAVDSSDSGPGAFQYSDANHARYRVLITSMKVSGHDGWFAGKVWQASNPAWVGQWLFAKVNDSSPKRIWGSFTTKAAAESGVSSMGTPADGPFNTTGALVVH